MRYLSTILNIAGIVAFFTATARARDRIQRNRGWTLGLGLITLGALANLVNPGPYTELPERVAVFALGVFLIGFGGATTYTATRSAIPCLLGRHPEPVTNKISAVTDDGEPVFLDVRWSPEALGDRELLLGSLLRHGHVVETRCAACGTLRPRHTGGA